MSDYQNYYSNMNAGQYIGLGQLNQLHDPILINYQQQINQSAARVQKAQEQLSKPTLPTVKTKEKKSMFSFAKDYTEKHKDSIMTIVVVLLVDYFFLGGALRQKIKSIAEGALDNAQRKLSHAPNAETKPTNAA